MLVAQLKSFFMVARLGSITLAAKQLGLSQPTVTSQIRALEEAYGVELFYRGGRRLTLSDAGVRLMPLVDQLVRQETEIDFFLRNSGDMARGTCASARRRRITCSTSWIASARAIPAST